MPSLFLEPGREADGDLPNFLIIVFDAWSARNISLYGYDRHTTPNLARLADRATVFHNHFAGGNYTLPGTSSILTGTYPFTHRGLDRKKGIAPYFYDHNLFSTLDTHYRLSYTHNPIADKLTTNFDPSIDKHKPRQSLFVSGDLISGWLFKNDEDIASISWRQAMGKRFDEFTDSLFLSKIYRTYKNNLENIYADQYPRGLTNINETNFYLLDSAIDWTIEQMPIIPNPFFAYIHYLPPHGPYNTRNDFIDRFIDDGYRPKEKPEHIFSEGHPFSELEFQRRLYDEFILMVDEEFGRLFDQLDRSGILENTYLILTSDHGEMSERGILEHYNPSLHLPIIQVPLLIFEPGQTERRDVFTPTSNVDLMPTLLHLANQPIPAYVEGQILPPFQPSGAESSRAIFAAEAKSCDPTQVEIDPGSFMIVKEGFKLTYYKGYEQLENGEPLVELYDLENDPEEMVDLSKSEQDLADDLLDELRDKLNTASEKSVDYWQ
jgi:arylsulfatase A-like enzyme